MKNVIVLYVNPILLLIGELLLLRGRIDSCLQNEAKVTKNSHKNAMHSSFLRKIERT